MDDVIARVSRGAKLLDRVNPGWAGRINLDRLAMESCDRCILGQLYGRYIVGWRAVARFADSPLRYSGCDDGFIARTYRYPDEFSALAEAWRGEIRARLASAVA